ncbi:hypothetical protein H0H92_006517 [Tricholoma furcatifolium]|nr:hypothetical protein H0H92_006517 [Tricholoma furcatifolium]
MALALLLRNAIDVVDCTTRAATHFMRTRSSYARTNRYVARDQEVNITTQLNLGVRMLQAQSHENNGVLHFCHTKTWKQLLFDGGPVVTYLETVRSWLDANPTEVVTFLFTNPEGVDLQTVWKPAFDDSGRHLIASGIIQSVERLTRHLGITPLVYVPPTVPMKQSDWPTLGDMINSGKRVVVFLDTGANTTLVDFILPEFEMIWETPYDVTNASFPCSVDRITGPLATEDHMYLINHGLNINLLDTGIIISDPEDAPTTNGVASIIDNVNECVPLGAGRAPSFILLDFVNIGQGLEAADVVNGLRVITLILESNIPLNPLIQCAPSKHHDAAGGIK